MAAARSARLSSCCRAAPGQKSIPALGTDDKNTAPEAAPPPAEGRGVGAGRAFQDLVCFCSCVKDTVAFPKSSPETPQRAEKHFSSLQDQGTQASPDFFAGLDPPEILESHGGTTMLLINSHQHHATTEVFYHWCGALNLVKTPELCFPEGFDLGQAVVQGDIYRVPCSSKLQPRRKSAFLLPCSPGQRG